MPKGKTECYSNENVKVSTIEIIRTTFDTPVQEEFERETQDNDHSLEVEWTTIGLYSLQQRTCLPGELLTNNLGERTADPITMLANAAKRDK